LTTNWETLLVTRSTVCTDLGETLDIPCYFSTEITLDDVLLEFVTDEIELRF
jgi:hypothetical protein